MTLLAKLTGKRLTTGELADLTAKAHAGDKKARERIVASNMGLAIAIAHKHAWCGLAPDDLEQEAMVGLLNAVDRFDPSRGISFSTFATYYIRGAVMKAACDSPIASAKSSNFRKMVWNRQVKRHISLDSETSNDDDRTLHDMMGVDAVAEDNVIRRDKLSKIYKAVNRLHPTSRHIFKLRVRGLELNEIGKRIGRSRERVRQLEKGAILKVRKEVLRGDQEAKEAAEKERSCLSAYKGTVKPRKNRGMPA